MKGRIVEFGEGRLWGPVFEEPYSIVGTLLSQDVQRCLKSCDYYLGGALDIAAGNDTPLEIRGNGNIVRIMPSWVMIGNVYDEDIEPAVISVDAFVAVMRYWKSIVASWDKQNPPSDPPEFSYPDPMPSPPLSVDAALQEFKLSLAELEESRSRSTRKGGSKVAKIRGHHRDHPW